MKEGRSGPIIAAVVAIPLLLFGAYMGSYYGMLGEPVYKDQGGGPLAWSGPFPRYKAQGDVVAALLNPAHQVNRLIRPNYWGDE